jgi:hypothetical protein
MNSTVKMGWLWTLSSGRVECVDCCNVLAVEAVSETSIAKGRNVLAKEPVLRARDRNPKKSY